MIQIADIAIIIGQDLSNSTRASWPPKQHLVSNRHIAIVEGVLGKKVAWQGNLGGVIAHRKIQRNGVRVVRRVEGNITKERSFFLLIGQKLNCFVRKHFTTMLWGGAWFVHLAIDHIR